MSMGGSVRLRRNAVRLVSDHCPACVGLLSGTDRKPCPPSPKCAITSRLAIYARAGGSMAFRMFKLGRSRSALLISRRRECAWPVAACFPEAAQEPQVEQGGGRAKGPAGEGRSWKTLVSNPPIDCAHGASECPGHSASANNYSVTCLRGSSMSRHSVAYLCCRDWRHSVLPLRAQGVPPGGTVGGTAKPCLNLGFV